MMKMIRFIALLFLVSVSFHLEVLAQKTLPEVSVKTLDGQSVKLEDAVKKGKITVLNFWATWCNPCKKELDIIKDLYPEWKEKYDVEFIAISIDDTRQVRRVKPLVAQKGWKYTIYTDEKGDLMRLLNFQTIPQTFLLDKNKNIIYSHNGYVSGDEFELEEQIKKAAGK